MITAEGFDAMGAPVSERRLSAGLAAVRVMMDLPTDEAMALVGRVARELERDEPYEAFRVARDAGLDLTGTYRLVATLLTEPTVECA